MHGGKNNVWKEKTTDNRDKWLYIPEGENVADGNSISIVTYNGLH